VQGALRGEKKNLSFTQFAPLRKSSCVCVVDLLDSLTAEKWACTRAWRANPSPLGAAAVARFAGRRARSSDLSRRRRGLSALRDTFNGWDGVCSVFFWRRTHSAPPPSAPPPSAPPLERAQHGPARLPRDDRCRRRARLGAPAQVDALARRRARPRADGGRSQARARLRPQRLVRVGRRGAPRSRRCRLEQPRAAADAAAAARARARARAPQPLGDGRRARRSRHADSPLAARAGVKRRGWDGGQRYTRPLPACG
jgi:hypothetical protein